MEVDAGDAGEMESKGSVVVLDESEPKVVESGGQESGQVSLLKIRKTCAQRTWDCTG